MKILTVEDDPEYLDMLQMVVKSIGHSIVVASNGKEALDLLARERVDVILADVNMPRMNGIEFHDRVRAMSGYAMTPFIFITGTTDTGAVKAACTTEHDLLLLKPIPFDDLVRLFSGRLKI